MTDYIFNFLYESINASFSIALLASFGWGIMSIILSPCHLSSIPLVVGYLSSSKENKTFTAFIISLVFSIGILITIAIIGISTAYLGRIMGDIGVIGNYIVAFIFVIVGLYFLDILNFDWNLGILQKISLTGFAGAFILGLIFGLALGPCTFAFMAPVLGVVFNIANTNLFKALLLLSGFAIGHCLVIAIAGTLGTKIAKFINYASGSSTIPIVKKICGVLVILAAFYFIYLTF